MVLRVWNVAVLAVGLGVAALSGCSSSTSSFECSSSGDCGGDGRCEPTGFCSFPDPGCASGFRYSEFAESLSNQCVVDDGASTGLSTGPDDTATSAGPTGSTTASGTTGGSSDGSSGSSTSPGSSTGSSTGTTGSSSDSGRETTGGPSNCLLEAFDELPGLPIWFAFSDSPAPVTVENGELVLEVQSMAGPALAGLRTNIPADFSQGHIRAVLTEVPELSVATTAFALNDEVFGNTHGRTFGIRDGMIRIEQLSDGAITLLATEPLGANGLPVELVFEVGGDGSDLNYLVIRDDGAETQLYTEATPDWLDDAYVSLDAGNPSTDPTDGITRFDLVEVCGDGL